MAKAGRTKVNWQEAFAFWAALEPTERTYGAVAERFGVSDTAVRRRATREGWADTVARADYEARQAAARAAIRPRKDRIADTIRLADAVRVKYAQQLIRPGYDVRGADVAAILRMEALLEGEPTDRPQVELNLSKLSDEELATLRALRDKAAAAE